MRTVQIRWGAPETNSSSTHAITMCAQADLDAWKAGEVYLNHGSYGSTSEHRDKRFVTRDEAIDILTKHHYRSEADNAGLAALDAEALEELLQKNGISTYAGYFDEEYEEFEESFVTPGGETVVAFGYYG